jgi:hypothetical protein
VCRAFEGDAAVCQDIGVLTQRQSEMHVLFDEQGGDAFTLQRGERGEKLLNEDRTETERELINDQNFRLGNKTASPTSE